MAQTLESQALFGGLALVSRQIFGMGLALVNMLVSTRVLGPHKYGQFAIVVGLMNYAVIVGRLGLDVYLIRYPGDLKKRQVGVTQLIYLLIGCITFVVGIALGPFAAVWYKDPSLRVFFWGYSFVAPMMVMSGAYVALLERRMAYKQVAAIESAGQLFYICISIPIILYYASVWGLIVGAIGQSALNLMVAARISRVHFRPCWDWKEGKAQLKYGVGYATSTWIWEVRELASPLVIGRILGSEAVAFITLATKLIKIIGFAKFAIYRLYMSFLARLAGDRARMREALEAGLHYQVLVLAVPFIGFMAIGPEVIKNTIGGRWVPVLIIFPFIAIAQIVNGAFSLHSSALYVIGKNGEVSLFHLIHIFLFIPATWYLTTMLGNISGYGWAEIVALVSYAWIRHALQKHLFIIGERVIHINTMVGVAGIVVLNSIIDEPCWLRLLCCLLVVLCLLCGVQQNRTTSLATLNKIVDRLRLIRGV